MITRKIPKCEKHPKYRVVLAPRANCPACWDQYWATLEASDKIIAKQLKILSKAEINADGGEVSFIPTGYGQDPNEELAGLELRRRNLYK